MKRRIRKELLDELLADYKGPEDLTGPEGLLKQLTGALVERALGAELTEHLGYEPGAPGSTAAGNARNGTTAKTLTTEPGEIAIETPRDRCNLPHYSEASLHFAQRYGSSVVS